MRGKARGRSIATEHDRITPAHAGKRRTGRGLPHLGRDHPRPCGEKPAPDARRSAHIGSPPPMRGKDGDKLPAVRLSGITPAHAGKRSAAYIVLRALQDHPPPMRGKARRIAANARAVRITPAHAGKSVNPPPTRPQAQDHPRPCGEKYSVSAIHRTTLGSPPPMRGKENYVSN